MLPKTRKRGKLANDPAVGEQISRNGELGHLERDVAPMADDVDGLSSTASWCQGVVAGAPQRGRPSVKKFIRIDVDLGKNYFQVHALVSDVGPAVTRKLRRSKMHEFFSQIEPSLIGMEACGSAHYWARELKAMGHEVLLISAALR